MTLTVAIQMDHVASIDISGDSTFVLALEAQKRGHEVLHYEPGRLAMRDGRVVARFLGARQWDSAESLRLVERLLWHDWRS